MVGRLRERQYQLAAQKQNEAFLKHNYYQQTARYFERECGIARHYDSWNCKDLDSTRQQERTRKAEKLQARRNKLRTLLKEEEETYRRELEELNARKPRTEVPSLEELKKKLRERRTEQNLYFPKTCRRYQSYFVYSTESVGSRTNGFKDTDSQRSRVCRDSTNFFARYEPTSLRKNSRMSTDESKGLKEQENSETRWEVNHSPTPEDAEALRRPNVKFQMRYSRKSLENTNVTSEQSESQEYTPSKSSNKTSLSPELIDGKHTPPTNENGGNGHDKENHQSEARPSSPSEFPKLTESRSSTSAADNHWEPKTLRNLHDHNFGHETAVSGHSTSRETDEVDECTVKEHQQKVLNTTDNRQFEREKSLPWMRLDPNDKNLSKQMFLYLTHKELKCKIEDLAKRELHACTKHCWDEALRLRDMRNRLELIREKRLYSMETLGLDEEAKKVGYENIIKREEELAQREDACTDTTMYSEDAKALWKKWVHEDEGSVIKDARAQRETLMNHLEKEWQGLAIRDKDRITHSFQNILTDSSLQEEHKLTAALNAARMKSASSSP